MLHKTSIKTRMGWVSVFEESGFSSKGGIRLKKKLLEFEKRS